MDAPKIDPPKLRSLYEDLILNDTYLGDGSDADCQQLQAAVSYFESHRDQLLSAIQQRIAALGSPKLLSPTPEQLELYVRGKLPANGIGDELKRRIETLAASDPTVRQSIAELRQASSSMAVFGLSDLAAQADRSRQAAAQSLLLALAALALAKAKQRLQASAGAGYRGEENERVEALVCQADGSAALDAAGQPRKAIFHVVRAEIQTDGRCVIDLSTRERELWETPTGKFDISAALEYEHSRLEFAAEKIYRDGRASIVGQLPAAGVSGPLPAAAIKLVVTPRG